MLPNNDELIYITDNLISKNNTLYYENDSVNLTKINIKNIINYINELGWEEMDEEWFMLLFTKINRKHNPYFILDCGGSGNCLYYCVAEAINNSLQYPNNIIEKTTTMEIIKNITLKQITPDNFDIILMSYKTLYDDGELAEDWNPNDINTVGELQDELENCWGDHIIIQLMQEAIQKNIIVFNNYIFSNSTNNISSMGNELKYKDTILLYYLDNIHFQLIGKFNGKTIQTIFKKIPNEIINNLNKY